MNSDAVAYVDGQPVPCRMNARQANFFFPKGIIGLTTCPASTASADVQLTPDGLISSYRSGGRAVFPDEDGVLHLQERQHYTFTAPAARLYPAQPQPDAEEHQELDFSAIGGVGGGVNGGVCSIHTSATSLNMSSPVPHAQRQQQTGEEAYHPQLMTDASLHPTAAKVDALNETVDDGAVTREPSGIPLAGEEEGVSVGHLLKDMYITSTDQGLNASQQKGKAVAALDACADDEEEETLSVHPYNVSPPKPHSRTSISNAPAPPMHPRACTQSEEEDEPSNDSSGGGDGGGQLVEESEDMQRARRLERRDEEQDIDIAQRPPEVPDFVQRVGKLIQDRVHEHVLLPMLAMAIIDTPEFQRLRNLKQLGTTVFLYPGATHTRFEHCIGVAHLAQEMVTYLAARQPELRITEADVLCVTVAGLCHDIGHGPFSHLFESVVNRIFAAEREEGSYFANARTAAQTPSNHYTSASRTPRPKGTSEKVEWCHEGMSLQLLRSIFRKIDISKYGLNEQDAAFIELCISGLRPKKPWPENEVGRPPHKRFLVDIVANKRHGIDVDKLDYFLRDSLGVYGRAAVDVHFPRLLCACRVLPFEDEYQICYEEKLALNLGDIFAVRAKLHKYAYQHRIVKVTDYMVSDALHAANDYFLLQGSLEEEEDVEEEGEYDGDAEQMRSEEEERGGMGAYRRRRSSANDATPVGRRRKGPPRYRQLRISDCVFDETAFCQLGDWILSAIMASGDPRLRPAQNIIARLTRRDLYPIVGSATLRMYKLTLCEEQVFADMIDIFLGESTIGEVKQLCDLFEQEKQEARQADLNETMEEGEEEHDGAYSGSGSGSANNGSDHQLEQYFRTIKKESKNQMRAENGEEEEEEEVVHYHHGGHRQQTANTTTTTTTTTSRNTSNESPDSPHMYPSASSMSAKKRSGVDSRMNKNNNKNNNNSGNSLAPKNENTAARIIRVMREVLIISFTKITYGSSDDAGLPDDPVNKVTFYNPKNTAAGAFRLPQNRVSPLFSPSEFSEVSVMALVRHNAFAPVVRRAFDMWKELRHAWLTVAVPSNNNNSNAANQEKQMLQQQLQQQQHRMGSLASVAYGTVPAGASSSTLGMTNSETGTGLNGKSDSRRRSVTQVSPTRRKKPSASETPFKRPRPADGPQMGEPLYPPSALSSAVPKRMTANASTAPYADNTSNTMYNTRATASKRSAPPQQQPQQQQQRAASPLPYLSDRETGRRVISGGGGNGRQNANNTTTRYYQGNHSRQAREDQGQGQAHCLSPHQATPWNVESILQRPTAGTTPNTTGTGAVAGQPYASSRSFGRTVERNAYYNTTGGGTLKAKVPPLAAQSAPAPLPQQPQQQQRGVHPFYNTNAYHSNGNEGNGCIQDDRDGGGVKRMKR